MREIRKKSEMVLFARNARAHGKRIALVPTMGALHEGHLSLVAEARKRADAVVVSIFVNPIQFSPNEDLNKYPRSLSRDKAALKELGVDILFRPAAESMFPPGFKSYVEVDGLSKKLCGRSRPTHFRGVTTVVAKLFNIIRPDLAFFGLKDYQQQLLIKQMVSDLDLGVEIVALPTVREFDGLAMSSRNSYLTAKERQTAQILYRSLCLAQQLIAGGERDLNRIMYKLRSLLGTEPSIRLDYLAAVDPETLEEVKKLRGKVLFAVAAYLGKARLIDNLLVDAG
ncbi:MAG: pantoate--beta-alanine ligase [Candidatus Margulisbacteria bacterium]|jgi:pantoate--beta-alanine ligase|nr:pantoate--beta-alanine ligase [Candidatus Margulisiibacteriota bacterium]